MTSVDSNFNFLCGRPHVAGFPPPPCGRHKWMAPKKSRPTCLHLLRYLVTCRLRYNKNLRLRSGGSRGGGNPAMALPWKLAIEFGPPSGAERVMIAL